MPTETLKFVPLNEVKRDLSSVLREAEHTTVVITRHGKPAGVLTGFEDEDEFKEWRLLNDPVFLSAIDQARERRRKGIGKPWRKLKEELDL